MDAKRRKTGDHKATEKAEQKASDDHAEQEKMMKEMLFYNRRGMAIEEKTAEREHILILAWRGEPNFDDDYSPTLELGDGYDSCFENDDPNPNEPDSGDAIAVEFGELCNIKSPVKRKA